MTKDFEDFNKQFRVLVYVAAGIIAVPIIAISIIASLLLIHWASNCI